MQTELLNQAIKLFDTPEKWNAFIELTRQKDNIKSSFFKKAKQPILDYFNKQINENWICEPCGHTDYDVCWYLKDFGKNSLAIRTGWRFQFHLRVEDLNAFDTNEIDRLLKTDYSLILTKFDRIDRQFEPNSKVIENRGYSFGSPFDNNFHDEDKFAWYVGNRTQEYTKQLIEKVERFTNDETITKMMYELNRQSKKQ